MLTRKKQVHFVAFIIVVLIFLVVPLTLFPEYYGHDFATHLNRIHCISDNLLHKNYFSPIYKSTLNNYGYAFPLFYGDIFLYPLALLILIGVPDKIVVSIVIYICVLATLFTSYYAGTKILKNDSSTFVFSFLYSFSSYLSVSYLTRYSVGEMFAAVFLPLVLLGFWSVFFDSKKYWIWLPLGLSGITYSHVLSTVITIIIVIIASIINIKKIIKDSEIIKRILISFIIYICLTAAFIFPLIEQLLSKEFVSTTNQSSTIFGTLLERSMPTKYIFSDFILFYDQYNYFYNWIPNGIGLFPVLTIVFALFIYKTKNIRFYFIYLFGLFFLYATTVKFPWELFQNIFGIIQFPWRLMLYATLFMALSSSVLVKDYQDNKFVIIVCAMSLFSFFMASYSKYKENYNVALAGFDYNYDYYNQIGTGEYLPAYVNKNGEYESYNNIKAYLEERGETVTSNNLTSLQISFVRGYNVFDVEYTDNDKENSYIEVPLLMYKGYKAFDKENNKELRISYGDHNVIRIYIDGLSGGFIVKYCRTPIQISSLIMSIISIIFLLSITIYKEQKKNLLKKSCYIKTNP